MLGRMTSTLRLFQLVMRAALLGWTRFGSPGIFGMPPSNALCSPAYSLAGQDRNAAGCQGSFGRANRPRTTLARRADHRTRRTPATVSATAQAGAR